MRNTIAYIVQYIIDLIKNNTIAYIVQYIIDLIKERMAQSLFSRQSPPRIQLQQPFQQPNQKIILLIIIPPHTLDQILKLDPVLQIRNITFKLAIKGIGDFLHSTESKNLWDFNKSGNVIWGLEKGELVGEDR